MSSSFYKIKDTLMRVGTFLSISASNTFVFSGEQESDSGKNGFSPYTDFTDGEIFKQHFNAEVAGESAYTSQQYDMCLKELDKISLSLSDLYNILVEQSDSQNIVTFEHKDLIEAIMSIDAIQEKVYKHMNHSQDILRTYSEPRDSLRSVYEGLYMLNMRLVRLSGDLKSLELLVFEDMLDDDHEEESSYHSYL